jgi:sn-glycerol 3-phosphate transport system ATP-binding protein
MSRIELTALSKAWGDVRAVDAVSLTAEAGQFVVLLGPSGCGKSTLLRMVAGLETPTSGTVRIDGRDVTGLDPARRGISMVFQSYALFPHLDVADNITFGLTVRKVPRAERARRLEAVAALVDLTALLDRKPAQLSGGQRQRVALARAVIAEHAVCLMDEPLSNLDATLRHAMRVELRALQRRLGMTVLYVTHDQTEAMSMADQVVLMNGGRLVQAGPPEVLYADPATPFAARFIGAPPMNLLPLVPVPGGLALAADPLARPLFAGTEAGLSLGIRPEHLSLSRDGSGLEARIASADYHGADTVLGLRLSGAGEGSGAPDQPEILVRTPGRVTVEGLERVRLSWSTDAVRVFGPDGKRRDPLPRIPPLADPDAPARPSPRATNQA